MTSQQFPGFPAHLQSMFAGQQLTPLSPSSANRAAGPIATQSSASASPSLSPSLSPYASPGLQVTNTASTDKRNAISAQMSPALTPTAVQHGQTTSSHKAHSSGHQLLTSDSAYKMPHDAHEHDNPQQSRDIAN